MGGYRATRVEKQKECNRFSKGLFGNIIATTYLNQDFSCCHNPINIEHYYLRNIIRPKLLYRRLWRKVPIWDLVNRHSVLTINHLSNSTKHLCTINHLNNCYKFLAIGRLCQNLQRTSSLGNTIQNSKTRDNAMV